MAKKRTDSNGDGLLPLGKERVLSDAMGQQMAPTLFSVLNPVYRDGKCIRLSGRVTVKVVGGYYTITVACPSEQVQTSFVAASLSNLIEQIESSLSDGRTVWLPDYDSQKKARQDAKR